MRHSTLLAPLQELLSKKPIFSAAEARAANIPARMLAHFCQQGHITRVSRGIYRGTYSETGLDFDVEDLILTAQTIPSGVVCLISALCLYQFTDQLMRDYWIAIPNANKSPKRPHVRIVRMRNMNLGKTTMQVGQFEINIFDRERTIVDAFRYLSHEIAIKALQAYIKSPSQKGDLVKLSSYAKELRVNITPYILALTT